MSIEKRLNELLRKWQKRLGLLDWDIEIRIRHNMPAESEAQINYRFNRRQAVIEVLHPDSYAELGISWGQDIEYALVHELLHLWFAPFEAGSNKLLESLQEQAICAITKALVSE